MIPAYHIIHFRVITLCLEERGKSGRWDCCVFVCLLIVLVWSVVVSGCCAIVFCFCSCAVCLSAVPRWGHVESCWAALLMLGGFFVDIDGWFRVYGVSFSIRVLLYLSFFLFLWQVLSLWCSKKLVAHSSSLFLVICSVNFPAGLCCCCSPPWKLCWVS